MAKVNKLIRRYNEWGWKYFLIDLFENKVKYKYSQYIPGELAMKKMVDDFIFNSVIDIGCGEGAASKFFTEHGKCVTACDYGRSVHFENFMAENVIIGDFNQMEFKHQYDAVWCSHILEHQMDVQYFLTKINRLLAEGAYLELQYKG